MTPDRRDVGRSLLSGLGMACAFPSISAWALAWFALVPLLIAVRGKTTRRAFALGWLAGFAFYLPVLYWIAPTITNYTRISLPQSIAVLVLLCAVVALFIGAFTATIEWLARAGIGRIVSAPVAIVVVEWLRTFFPAAFPWALFGYSQAGALAVIQIADLGGVYLISALLAFVNAGIAELRFVGLRSRPRLAAATLLVPALALAYGGARLAQIDAYRSHRTLAVGIAQANIAQDEKWDRRFENRTLDAYLRLSRAALDDGARLLVWPEAAVPFYVPEDPRGAALSRLAVDARAELLAGSPGYDPTTRLYYNRAWQIRPDGRYAAYYDKIRLVPFGEYVPFGPLLAWVDKAVEVIGTFGRGREHVVFDGPADSSGLNVRYSALICYEGIFPALTRRFVADGAELLLNISNDAWYGRTSAPYQHLEMAAVRAVENRVPLVRSTNTGISAVIDRSGRIRARTPLFEEAWFVEDVDVGSAGSLYARFGDVFVYGCIALLAVLVVARFRNGVINPVV